MQLSDRHTIPTPALLPTCTVALYKAVPSPEPVTESLTPPVLGAFTGETLDPANASYENAVLIEPRLDKTLTIIDNPFPTPGDIRHRTLLSALHADPPHPLFPSTV
jgi:hypothetical protein